MHLRIISDEYQKLSRRASAKESQLNIRMLLFLNSSGKYSIELLKTTLYNLVLFIMQYGEKSRNFDITTSN